METTTWEALIAFIVAVVAIGVPGGLIGAALRLRGLWLAATAPLLGIGSIALASLWAGLLHMPWGWWEVLATAGVIAALALTLAPMIAKPHRSTADNARWRWAAPIGVSVGILLMSWRLFTAIGEPGWFDQAGDNVFHLNAVRWILDSGIASPLSVMQGLDPASSVTFYPTAWHSTVALVCQLSGATIPIASNAVLVVIAGTVWPLGAILLTRTFFGPGTALLIAAGAISAGFAMYPLLLIPYMGTYPLVLAIALIPAALATVGSLVGISRTPIPPLAAAVVVAVTLPGIAVAHPSAVTMLAVLTLPLVVASLWRHARAHPKRWRLATLLALLYTLAVLALVVFVRPNFTQPNSPRSSTGQAIGEVLTGAFVGQPIPFVLTALMIVGGVVAARAGGVLGWSAIGIWLAASLIYMAAVSNDEFAHLLISQPWYADATRVAAFTPITIVPLAARGAEWLWNTATASVDFAAHPARRRVAEITAVLLLGFAMVQSTAARYATDFMLAMFTPTDNSLISPIPVSTDDRALLAHVPSLVPRDAVIAGDPWTGASFAYALTGRRVLVPHLLAPVTGQTKIFFEGISTSAIDGPACRAARNLGVGWVLQLHGGETLPNRPHYAGLIGLSTSPNMKLADSVGDSSLFKIVGCGFG